MTASQIDPVVEIEVLSADECARVRSSLQEMREHWIQRHPVAPFYTLGASNYFDIAYNPLLPYYRMAARFNPIMRERLGWLYDRVAEKLSQHFSAPVTYRENLALPGFHIFLSHQSFEHPQNLTHMEWFRAKGKADVVANPIHCDTAHKVVDWSGAEAIDFDNPISITLPIALPRTGAGLNVWDFGLERSEGLSQSELHELLNTSDTLLHSYQLGSLATHSGLRYHQVAAMNDLQPDDERITLQGHGVLCEGTWQLFW